MFDRKENLELIGNLIDRCLLGKNDDDTFRKIPDSVKAVACYDLGEFARYYVHGKAILNRRNLKEIMAQLMGDKDASSEVKKEAITCY